MTSQPAVAFALRNERRPPFTKLSARRSERSGAPPRDDSIKPSKLGCVASESEGGGLKDFGSECFVIERSSSLDWLSSLADVGWVAWPRLGELDGDVSSAEPRYTCWAATRICPGQLVDKVRV